MRNCWATILSVSLMASFAIAQPFSLQGEIGVDSMLRWLISVDYLPYLRDWKCLQFSSYDRTKGNADAGNFLRVENNVAVLAEMEGPGAIVRIWSANPRGRLRIYLDDMEKPVVDCPMRDFFEGRFSPVRAPIAMPSSGGVISYFPMPFAQKMRVTVQDPGPMYYHVTVVQFPKGTKVRTLKFPLTEVEQSALDEVLRVWSSPVRLPPNLSFEEHNFEPQRRKSVFEIRGPAIIKGLFISIPPEQFLAWRKAILRIYWDGEKSPSVEAPIGDFFGSGFGPVYLYSRLIGFTDEGIGYCYFPMPFAKSARIEIENGLSEPLRLLISVNVESISLTEIAKMGYFHAKWFWWYTRKGAHHQFMKAQNSRGHFVGAAMTMQSAAGLGFLEGDELFDVDGERVFNGTGTEDYYNSGWYFATGHVIAPLHGCVRKTDNSIVAYRIHINDAVVWQRESDLKIEHGGVSDTEGIEYSSIAWWYQTEPHTDFFKIPPATVLHFPRQPVILPSGSLIAAKLIEPQKGVEVIGLFRFTDAAGTEAVIVRPPQKNLVVPLKGVEPDRCDLFGYFVKRKDFGSVKVFIGEQLLATVDLRGERAYGQVVRISLGTVKVMPNQNIRVEGDGKRIFAVIGFELRSLSPFVTDWLIAGPFPSENGKGFEDAYPPEQAKDLQELLKVAEWKQVRASDGVLNLLPHFKPNTNVVAYALSVIEAPKEMETEFLVGSDDGVKIWLNGELVHSNRVYRGLAIDQDKVKVKLKQGSNLLLVKVENGGGDWAVSVRVRDPESLLKFSLPK
ncbi:MAG: DUF2961 domain-containing protein [Armatimonadetes bacterium]|nr:DUF2961 domain-containing protein [Armatimonadota bacterium]MDW8028532.1 glycoside hydrolase family 172 protein [Armatimonadota bacterium]